MRLTVSWHKWEVLNGAARMRGGLDARMASALNCADPSEHKQLLCLQLLCLLLPS